MPLRIYRENMMVNNNKPESCRCPSCDGFLLFDIGYQKLRCDKCDRVLSCEEYEALKGNTAVPAASQSEEIQETGKRNEYISRVNKTSLYTCSFCGGAIYPGALQAFVKCPFCERPIILNDKIKKDKSPDIVIPFMQSKNTLLKKLKKLCDERSFIRRGFLDALDSAEITARYYPFWIYDVDVEGRGTCQMEKLTYRQPVLTHECYNNQMTCRLTFSSIPQDASRKFSDDVSQSVEPFNINQSRPYSAGYLSGLDVVLPDIKEKAGFATVKQRVLTTAKEKTRQSLRYFHEISRSSEFNVKPVSIVYAIFPVWEMTVKCDNEEFTFAMNGQTGRLVGTLPADEIAPYRRAAFLTVVNLVVSTIIMCACSILSKHAFELGLFLVMVTQPFYFIVNIQPDYNSLFEDERMSRILFNTALTVLFLLVLFVIFFTKPVFIIALITFFCVQPMVYKSILNELYLHKEKRYEEKIERVFDANDYFVAEQSSIETTKPEYTRTYDSTPRYVTVSAKDGSVIRYSK